MEDGRSGHIQRKRAIAAHELNVGKAAAACNRGNVDNRCAALMQFERRIGVCKCEHPAQKREVKRLIREIGRPQAADEHGTGARRAPNGERSRADKMVKFCIR